MANRGRPIESKKAFGWTRRHPALASLILVTVIAVLSIVGLTMDHNRSLEEAARREQRRADEADLALDVEPHGVAFSEDSRQLAIGSKKEVLLYAWREDADAHRWHPTEVFNPQDHDTRVLVFSPGGRWLAMATRNGARVEVNSVGVVDHGATVLTVTFSPDARLLATGGSDGDVAIWDVETGGSGRLLTLHGHDAPIKAIAFFPGGRQLATAGDDGVIKLWDLIELPDGLVAEERGTLRRHRGSIKALVIAPGGELILSVGGETDQFGEVKVFRGRREEGGMVEVGG